MAQSGPWKSGHARHGSAEALPGKIIAATMAAKAALPARFMPLPAMGARDYPGGPSAEIDNLASFS